MAAPFYPADAMPADAWLAHARESYDAGEEHLGELESQYRSECAMFGDAGPGQGLRVRAVKRELAQMRARYAQLTGGRDLWRDACLSWGDLPGPADDAGEAYLAAYARAYPDLIR